jgi:hypothetical protein
MGFNFNRKYTRVTKTRPELSSGRRFRLVFEGVRWQNARPVVVGAALIGSYRLLGPIRWRPRPTSAFVIRPRKGKLLIMQLLKRRLGTNRIRFHSEAPHYIKPVMYTQPPTRAAPPPVPAWQPQLKTPAPPLLISTTVNAYCITIATCEGAARTL